MLAVIEGVLRSEVSKPKKKLTYGDYAKTPEDERWELIDGELIRLLPPK